VRLPWPFTYPFEKHASAIQPCRTGAILATTSVNLKVFTTGVDSVVTPTFGASLLPSLRSVIWSRGVSTTVPYFRKIFKKKSLREIWHGPARLSYRLLSARALSDICHGALSGPCETISVDTRLHYECT